MSVKNIELERSEKIIELKNVTRIFDGVTVLDSIDLYVRKGEFVTILGPSGCGKTTTLRMIAGFDKPDSGEILFHGKDISKIPPYERPINTVFQRYALFPQYNVYNNIAYGLKLKKVEKTYVNNKGETLTRLEKLTKKEIDEKVSKALKMVDLEGFESRDVQTLSGGQQQRIAIARAIVNEPEVLLLDEPLGALDLKMRQDMQIELKEMHKKLGITFVYITHDQEEALTMSDTIVVMNDGVIQQIGSPEDIYNEPKNTFVADFIGDSNIFNGTIVGDRKVKFLNKVFDMVDDFPLYEKVDVVVRPEDIYIVNKGLGHVDGKVISTIFKGVHYEMTVKIGKAEITVQDTLVRQVGEEVSLIIKPDDIHIMHKRHLSNVFDGYIGKNNEICFAESSFNYDVTKLYQGSTLDSEGYLITEEGEKLDLTDTQVIVDIPFDKLHIKDATSKEEDVEGVYQTTGNIISIIYKGDHYQLIVRTPEEEEDFIIDTDDLWNENDKVIVYANAKDITVKLKETK